MATPSRKKTVGVLAVLALVLLAVGLVLERGGTDGADVARTSASVPDRAVETLRLIDLGTWPDAADAPGTKGGDRWGNREGRLPRTDSSGAAIDYREWDVNPKKPRQSRDAERIVTGSDGSAWFTADHYETFTRMR